MTNAKNSQNDLRKDIPALTSLRFFAALSVLLFHIKFVLVKSVGNQYLFTEGFLGVNFFFVLSGFILAHVYASKEHLGFDFYFRRLAKIVPLHYLTFIVWSILFYFDWGVPVTDKINSGVANLLLIHSLFNGPLYNLGYNAVSWSISVELFFYLLFPFIRKGWRASIILLMYLIIVAIFSYLYIDKWFSAVWPDFFYFNPLYRLFEFCVGVTVYRLFSLNISKSSGSILQFISVFVLIVAVIATKGLPGIYRNITLSVPFAAIVLTFSWSGLFSDLLSMKPLVNLGEASFALYMTHHMFFRIIDEPMANLILWKWLVLPVPIVGAIVVSLIVHIYFEKPIRNRILKFRFPAGKPFNER